MIPIGTLLPVKWIESQKHPDRFFLMHQGLNRAKIIPKGMIMNAVDSNKALGQIIRKERKDQGLTQEELAALAGVGVRFVRELEHGKETCRIGLTLQVLRSLGLSLAVSGRGETA